MWTWIWNVKRRESAETHDSSSSNCCPLQPLVETIPELMLLMLIMMLLFYDLLIFRDKHNSWQWKASYICLHIWEFRKRGRHVHGVEFIFVKNVMMLGSCRITEQNRTRPWILTQKVTQKLVLTPVRYRLTTLSPCCLCHDKRVRIICSYFSS